MGESILLTGATGFIGSSLLQKWLKDSDASLSLLVRRKREEDPAYRIARLLGELYPNADISHLSQRIEVVEGDVSTAKFGLEDSEYERLARKVSHIIHCAAAARFDLELEDARKTNVAGTQNVLDFARNSQRLERIDYVGTAYVAGRRKGVIREDELDKGQEHNNTYERSKFEAERLVRESASDLPITILRPSIVICDSNTGRASSFNGFYRALRMYWLGRLKVLPGHPSCPMDLVPVDYVVDATYTISRDPASAGRCYHLTAGLNNATLLEEVRDLASHHFGRERFTIVPPEEFEGYVSRREGELSQDERDMIEELRLYAAYLTGELRFDNSNTIEGTGSEAPSMSTYFGKMAEYIIKQEAEHETA